MDDGPIAGADEQRGLGWIKVVALAAACGFLGLAAGLALSGRSSVPTVDSGFAQDMILHHEQAVEMSVVELRNGTDTTVRKMAQEIVIFQQYEIGRMEEWLNDWDLEPRDGEGTAMGWMGHPVRAAAMPGLATEAQLEALRAATGRAADALFLQLMAEHHRAGAEMAAHAAEHAEDADVRDLAARMAQYQSVEINEMIQAAQRSGLPVTIAPYRKPAAGAHSGGHTGHG